MHELARMSARAVVAALRNGEVTPAAAIDAALERIRETDPVINAVPTLCEDRARRRASRLPTDRRDDPGYLHGLPVLIKDLTDVEGVRTTYGSPVYADHVPERSDIVVERIERMGGVVLGKTNTPEFGAGSQTFNKVFGVTRNPWDPSKTVGGSSGGAAAALAAGSAWLATGSDLGGSLRNPASFCSVTGLRCSSGTVAHGPRELAWDSLMISGPMARDIADLALFLDTMAGFDARDPLSRPRTPDPAGGPATYTEALDPEAWPARPRLRRVAWTTGFGYLPCDPEVAAITERAAGRFAELGADVVPAEMDLGQAEDIFQTLRADLLATDKGALHAAHGDSLKADLRWNIELGLALERADAGRAALARGRMLAEVQDFFVDHDLLLAPVAMVPPFSADVPWPRSVAGVEFDNYVGWLMTAATISLTDCPALSVPCGYTEAGLPVGLQVIAPARHEGRLLYWARRFEELAGIADGVPRDPATG